MLRHAANIPKDYDEAGPDGRLISVIIDQLSFANTPVINLPLPSDPRIQKIERDLIENPADNRNLEAFAEDLCISTRTLSRAFQLDINMPFRDWRNRLRLVAALRLLALGESVATTALSVGFSSESAFIERFKQAMGITPGRYQRKI